MDTKRLQTSYAVSMEHNQDEQTKEHFPYAVVVHTVKHRHYYHFTDQAEAQKLYDILSKMQTLGIEYKE
jgi:hypothetical protein